MLVIYFTLINQLNLLEALKVFVSLSFHFFLFFRSWKHFFIRSIEGLLPGIGTGKTIFRCDTFFLSFDDHWKTIRRLFLFLALTKHEKKMSLWRTHSVRKRLMKVVWLLFNTFLFFLAGPYRAWFLQTSVQIKTDIHCNIIA